MLFELFDDLNWLAIVVAALAFFVLGSIWYTNALFGRQYRAAIGQEDGSPVNVTAIVVNAIGWFVAALALALISKAIGASTVADGIVLGLVVSVGFIGANSVVAQLYEGSNRALMMINAPYTVLGYMIMGVILATWT